MTNLIIFLWCLLAAYVLVNLYFCWYIIQYWQCSLKLKAVSVIICLLFGCLLELLTWLFAKKVQKDHRDAWPHEP